MRALAWSGASVKLGSVSPIAIVLHTLPSSLVCTVATVPAALAGGDHVRIGPVSAAAPGGGSLIALESCSARRGRGGSRVAAPRQHVVVQYQVDPAIAGLNGTAAPTNAV
jgi:hypothetical protein